MNEQDRQAMQKAVHATAFVSELVIRMIAKGGSVSGLEGALEELIEQAQEAKALVEAAPFGTSIAPFTRAPSPLRPASDYKAPDTVPAEWVEPTP